MNIPLNIDFQQVLLHLLNFVILAGALYFLLYKPVKNFMDKRTEDMKAQEQAAENALSEAEAMKTEYEEKLQNIEKEAVEIRSQAEKAGDEAGAAAVKHAEAQAREIIEKAQKQADKDYEDALKRANTEIAELASEAARRITTDDDYKSFSEAVKRGEANE